MIIKKNANYPELFNIGERIKKLRLEKRMTQSKLADSNITRNMLSRIENGAALPSLPTLCAIANKLDVPVGALLENPQDYTLWKLSLEARRLVNEGKYEKAVLLYGEDISKIDNNSASILLKAYTELANNAYNLGNLSKAIEYLSQAENIVSTFKCPNELKQKPYLLKILISSSPIKNELNLESEKDKLYNLVFDENELAVYLYALSVLGDIAESPYSQPNENAIEKKAIIEPLISNLENTLYRTHIMARLDMAAAEYLGAKAKLLTICKEDLPPMFLYSLYLDLELCCKCCGDFENAYKFSGRRIDLIKKIK